MGVLREVQGRNVFQAKVEMLEATEQRIATLQRFRADLMRLLGR